MHTVLQNFDEDDIYAWQSFSIIEILLLFKRSKSESRPFLTPLGTKQLSKMTVFNDQAHIQIGGQWNDNLRRVERPFRGILAGVTFNGLRPLDLAGAGDARIKINGDVQKLNNIPFDYREKHPELFTKDAIRLMIDQIYKDKNHAVTPDLSKYT